MLLEGSEKRFIHRFFFSKKKIKAKRKKVCTSPLQAELLNVTFSYEGELKCSPRGDEEKKKGGGGGSGGWDEMEIFFPPLTFSRQSLQAFTRERALFLERDSKWSILCLAER